MDYDPDTIRTALELVTKGSQATGSALKVIEQFKTMLGGAKQTDNDKGLPRQDVEALVTSLMTQLQDARLANIDLKEQLVELKEQALKAQRTQDEFGRYELWKTSRDNFVYRLKANEAAPNEELHYICPKCLEDGTKSILQGSQFYKDCPTCKTKFAFNKAQSPQRMVRNRGI
mgnify:CR=1 FL=1